MTKATEAKTPVDKTADADPQSQAELSRQALAMKQDGAKPQPHPTDPPVADPGMSSVPREGYPPSGAFGAEGQRPVLERSRKAR